MSFQKIFLSTVFLVGVYLLFPQTLFAETIKINEALVHPSSGNKEWVELYNPEKVDVSDYFLDDDTNFSEADETGSSKKNFQDIQNKDSSFPYLEISSMFNNAGDSIVLFHANGTIVDQYTYAEDPKTDISLGRSPDGTGAFTLLASSTKGNSNSSPLPTPTPTSSPTPTPSKTPTPTPTKKPTPTPKPSPTKIPTKDIELEEDTPYIISSQGRKPGFAPTAKISPSQVASLAATNDILGASISATPTPKPKKKTQVKGITQKSFPVYLALGGVILLAGCGIVGFQIYKNRKGDST